MYFIWKKAAGEEEEDARVKFQAVDAKALSHPGAGP
jgi:hypothetical protein